MARPKTILCPSCHRLFSGKSNAKTCSDRCRKRYQRALVSLQKELVLERSIAELSAIPIRHVGPKMSLTSRLKANTGRAK